jgi:transcriptional regulator with XRE-family HTH domain
MCISNEILLRNIELLCKEKNKKKYELELQIGVSNGYFARLSKTPSTFPGGDVLLKLSEVLNADIDLLLKQNINSMGQNSRLIHKLVNMLCQRTINGEIQWKELPTICSLAEISFKREIPSDYKIFYCNNPYETKMDNGLIIGIQPLIFKPKKDLKEKLKSVNGYEIYYSLNEQKNTICFSDLVSSVTKKLIEQLAFFITREIQDVQIANPETINVIKSLVEN